MNTKYWIPLCAAVALISACGAKKDDSGGEVSVETVPDQAPAPAPDTAAQPETTAPAEESAPAPDTANPPASGG